MIRCPLGCNRRLASGTQALSAEGTKIRHEGVRPMLRPRPALGTASGQRVLCMVGGVAWRRRLSRGRGGAEAALRRWHCQSRRKSAGGGRSVGVRRRNCSRGARGGRQPRRRSAVGHPRRGGARGGCAGLQHARVPGPRRSRQRDGADLRGRGNRSRRSEVGRSRAAACQNIRGYLLQSDAACRRRAAGHTCQRPASSRGRDRCCSAHSTSDHRRALGCSAPGRPALFRAGETFRVSVSAARGRQPVHRSTAGRTLGFARRSDRSCLRKSRRADRFRNPELHRPSAHCL